MPSTTLPSGRPVEYDRSGEGPPVLLIPGLGDRRAAWAATAGDLAREFSPISYDLRGYSGDEAGVFTIGDLAADSAGLIESLIREPAFVIGHSEGGFIALELALVRPDLVRGLIVVSSASYTDEYGRKLLAHWREVAEGMGGAALAREMFLWGFSPNYFNSRAREVRLLQSLAADRETPLDAYLAHNHACTTYDVRGRLPSLAVPTLLLGGTADIVMTLRHNQILLRLIRGSRLVTFEGVGHHLCAEAPEEASEVFVDFLRTQSQMVGGR